jgi:hypothetical protein
MAETKWNKSFTSFRCAKEFLPGTASLAGLAGKNYRITRLSGIYFPEALLEKLVFRR